MSLSIQEFIQPINLLHQFVKYSNSSVTSGGFSRAFIFEIQDSSEDLLTLFKPLAIHLFIKGVFCFHLVACC